MTRETAEVIYSILNGIGVALFFCIGLGGAAITSSFTMFWITLPISIACWVASKFILAYATEVESDN
jgi:hypothetical protein